MVNPCSMDMWVVNWLTILVNHIYITTFLMFQTSVPCSMFQINAWNILELALVWCTKLCTVTFLYLIGGTSKQEILGFSRENRGVPKKTIGKPWENHGKTIENGGLMGFYGIYPLVMTNIAFENWKMAIEIVSFPIMNCDFPIVMLKIPEGTNDSWRSPVVKNSFQVYHVGSPNDSQIGLYLQ